jgi:hypothetical protein
MDEREITPTPFSVAFWLAVVQVGRIKGCDLSLQLAGLHDVHNEEHRASADMIPRAKVQSWVERSKDLWVLVG